MWLLRGACLALALFGLTSATATLAATLVAPVARRWARGRSARLRAGVLFGLLLAPTALSLLVAFGLFVPAYAAFEPRGGAEGLGAALVLLAGASLIPIAAGAARGWRAYRVTVRLRARWMRMGVTVQVPSWSAPAVRVVDPFPVVSVLGIRRPRLFVAGQVLDRLDAAEVGAVIAHEAGHLEAHDNLRSLLLRARMDWLALLPAGRRLAEEWRHAAELAADERSRGCGETTALALASALIRVARLVPAGARLGLSTSSLLDGARVADRVERLLGHGTPAGIGPRVSPRIRLAAAVALAGALSATGTGVRALESVHALGETVLRLLA